MFDSEGEPRPHYIELFKALLDLPGEEMRRRERSSPIQLAPEIPSVATKHASQDWPYFARSDIVSFGGWLYLTQFTHLRIADSNVDEYQ